MEEGEIINCLIDSRYRRRDLALNSLEDRVSSSKNGFLFFLNPQAIFKALSVVLVESVIESVKIQCLNIMVKIIPTLRKDLEDCVSHMVPVIFKHFVNSRSSVVLHATKVWQCYVEHSSNSQNVVDDFVEHGLNSNDQLVKEYVTNNMLSLLDLKALGENVDHQELVDGLLKQCGLDNGYAKENIIRCLGQIEKIVGHDKYTSLLANSPFHMKFLFACSSKEAELTSRTECLVKVGSLSNIFLHLFNVEDKCLHERASYELMEIFSEVSFESLKPNLNPILKLTANLFKERNLEIKIVLELLQVIEMIVEKLGYENLEYLDSLVANLIHWVLSESEEVRQLVLSTFRRISHFVPSEFFMASLFPYMRNNQPWPLRKNCVDIISMIFLNEHSKLSIGVDPLFGLKAQLIQLILGCLISSELLLKLSAFECLAVMGDHFEFPSLQKTSHRNFLKALSYLLEPFAGKEEEKRMLMFAMKMRLSRNLIPTIEDGRLIYSLDLKEHEGIDVEWIKSKSCKELLDGRCINNDCFLHKLLKSDLISEDFETFAYGANTGHMKKVPGHQNINSGQTGSPNQKKKNSLPPVYHSYKYGARWLLPSLIPRPVRKLPRIIPSSLTRLERLPAMTNASSHPHPLSYSLPLDSAGDIESSREMRERRMPVRNEGVENSDVDLISIPENKGGFKRFVSLKQRSAKDQSPQGSPKSKRQVSCGPVISNICSVSNQDVSTLEKMEIQNDFQASRSPSSINCSQLPAYCMQDLRILSEEISNSFERINRAVEPAQDNKIKNQNINNDRLTEEQPQTGRGEEDMALAVMFPKFPWKSKRKQLPKKKFFTEEFQADIDVDSHQLPITNPVASYNEALLGLSLDKWIEKCQALEMIKRLSLQHQDVIRSDVTSLTRSILKEVRNLRSKVSLLAVSTIGEMFCIFQRLMDKEVDEAAKVLLMKSGESNKFIREEAEKSLMSMVDHVTISRSLAAIVAYGTSHKNAMVQQTSSRLLKRILDNVGTDKILQNKELAEKFLPAVVGFLLAGSQVVRDQGQIVVRNMMMSGIEFTKSLHKYVPENIIMNAQDKLDFIKSTISAELSSSSLLGKSSTRIESECSNDLNTLKIIQSAPEIEGLNDQPPKGSLVLTNLTSQMIAGIETDLKSASWKERLRGLESLEHVLQEKPAYVLAIFEMLDSYLKCVSDTNDEVVLKSLSILDSLLILLNDHINNADNIVNRVVANTNSSNPLIPSAALKGLDSIMEIFEPFSLLPVFISNAMKCRRAFKVDFINRVHYLYSEALVQRPVQSTTTTYQFLWHLLGLLNHQQKSSNSPTKKPEDSVGDSSPTKSEHPSRSPSPVKATYHDIYFATQSLLYTIYTNSREDLAIRCKKLKARNRRLLVQMLKAVLPEQDLAQLS